MAELLTITRPDLERRSLTARVKRLAQDHGLAVAAVTSAEPFDGLERILTDHIRAGHAEGMPWFDEARASVASDPRRLHATARSILSVGIAYWTDPAPPSDGVPRGRIARYAWGRDYHKVLRRRMRSLLDDIAGLVGQPVEARTLVDTARISDRAVAARAGLGWYGKHSCVIVPGKGSWVLLGELLLDIDLEPDPPIEKNCGRCSICIDRCPTGAIVSPYTVSAPRCISFQTIEQRGAIPLEIRPLMGAWVFGCDVCQEVCPYTRAAALADDAELQPAHVDNAFPSLPWLLTVSEPEFLARYAGTAVMRAKRRGLARNAAVAIGNLGDPALVPVLVDALRTHDEPLVRAHAAWALGRLGGDAARGVLSARRGHDLPVVDAEIEAALASAC